VTKTCTKVFRKKCVQFNKHTTLYLPKVPAPELEDYKSQQFHNGLNLAKCIKHYNLQIKVAMVTGEPHQSYAKISKLVSY